MFIVYFFNILYSITNVKILQQLSYAVMFLISFSCLRFLKLKTRNSKLILLLFFYLIAMAGIGLLRQNWSSYILFDLKNFFFILILLIPFNENIHNYIIEKLPNQLAGWLYIGLPITWYFILTMGLKPGSASERISTNFDSVDSAISILQYSYKFVDFSVLLLPFLPYIKGFKKTLVILSVLTFLLASFFTLTRGGIFVCIISFISTAYILILQTKKIKQGLKLFLFISILLILIVQIYGLNRLNDTFSFFVERMNDKENFTSFREDERSDFFRLSSISEIIFGRGMGGSHNFGIWSGPQGANLKHGMNMTHYGYLYLILKGGIILLIAIYGLAIHSMIKLWRYEGVYKSFSIAIFLYLFYEISITKFYDPFYLFLLLMALYLAKNLPKYSKENKLLIQEGSYFSIQK